jgi:4-amino-4-deoxy-L-arabinose transferase-like glycosyltransferase
LSVVVTIMKKYPQTVIFVLALALRLGWVLALDNHLTWIDEREFAAVGEHLARGEGYLSTSSRANPVLPYYLGVAFRLFGSNYVAARVGQSILGALTCVLVYRLGSVLVDSATGVLSSVLLASYPLHIYLAGVWVVALQRLGEMAAALGDTAVAGDAAPKYSALIAPGVSVNAIGLVIVR